MWVRREHRGSGEPASTLGPDRKGIVGKRELRRFVMRRKFLIDKELQRRLFLRSLVATLLIFLVAVTALAAPLVLKLQNVTPTSWEDGDVALLLLYLYDHLLPVAVVTLVVSGLMSLRSSHKIAGPLYRFTQVFRSITSGSIPGPVTTREGDFLKREVIIINDMVEGLRQRAVAIHDAKSELLTAIRECRSVAGPGAGSALEECLSAVEERAKRLEAELERFRVGSGPAKTTSSESAHAYEQVH